MRYDIELPLLRELTPQEKLLVWRRRLEMNQETAGARFGMSAWQYGQMERGEVPILAYAWRGPFRIYEHEFCFLSRLRAKITQQQIAEDLGCSRIHVNKMESGKHNCIRLVGYWGSKNVWKS